MHRDVGSPPPRPRPWPRALGSGDVRPFPRVFFLPCLFPCTYSPDSFFFFERKWPRQNNSALPPFFFSFFFFFPLFCFLPPLPEPCFFPPRSFPPFPGPFRPFKEWLGPGGPGPPLVLGLLGPLLSCRLLLLLPLPPPLPRSFWCFALLFLILAPLSFFVFARFLLS